MSRGSGVTCGRVKPRDLHVRCVSVCVCVCVGGEEEGGEGGGESGTMLRVQ